MFYQNDDQHGFVELLEGIELKTLVHGDKTLTAKFRLRRGSVLPLHRHPHEQTGYLISGAVEFQVDGETITAGPGDAWNIAGNVEHGARVLEDSVIIEVFHPVRDDYLPATLQPKTAA